MHHTDFTLMNIIPLTIPTMNHQKRISTGERRQRFNTSTTGSSALLRKRKFASIVSTQYPSPRSRYHPLHRCRKIKKTQSFNRGVLSPNLTAFPYYANRSTGICKRITYNFEWHVNILHVHHERRATNLALFRRCAQPPNVIKSNEETAGGPGTRYLSLTSR